MTQRLFLVDVENTGRTPFSGVMAEFGVVEFATQQTFHGHLYDTMPDPGRPGGLVLSGAGRNVFAAINGQQASLGPSPDPREVFVMLVAWMQGFGGSRAVFVSDNPGHDFMFFAFTCDQVGVENPFGHSARRIGDLAAGLKGKWRDTSSWKRYRRARHTHHPVDDAMGNAEALRTILDRHQQTY